MAGSVHIPHIHFSEDSTGKFFLEFPQIIERFGVRMADAGFGVENGDYFICERHQFIRVGILVE